LELQQLYQEKISEMPEPVIDNYQNVDPEKYRTLRMLEEFKTIDLSDIYHTQIISALNGIYRAQATMNFDYT